MLNGQRVVFRPGRPPLVVPPPVKPVGAEEITDVHPVGDHVLVTTSTGRILSAELVGGRVAWQTRLSDRPVDRLIANDDFTVARISDDATVRIGVFDTATGQIRCTHVWSAQQGMVPQNMALAADGTLVYTLPNSLCLQDLYKPWTETPTIETRSNPNTSTFAGATQPGQLIISEGRILALADDGSVKNIRIFSLETGQPVLLHYRSPQGDKDIERILAAGRSERVTMRVMGSHLYVVSVGLVYSYNLDKPEETWNILQGTLSLIDVRDVVVGKNWLVVIEAVAVFAPAQHGIPAPINPAIPVAPAPRPAPRVADGYQLDFFNLSPKAITHSGENGRMDYIPKIIDPSGITSQWQPIDGGFCYLAGDGKLHILRGTASVE